MGQLPLRCVAMFICSAVCTTNASRAGIYRAKLQAPFIIIVIKARSYYRIHCSQLFIEIKPMLLSNIQHIHGFCIRICKITCHEGAMVDNCPWW